MDLEITLQYAKDLNKVNLISKMAVYAVVSISGEDKNTRQKTKSPADHGGDANPMWRFTAKFTVEEAALRRNCLMLDFKLKCERALGDRVVGEVHVPVIDLLDSPANGGAGDRKFVSYQVKKPGGKPKGELTFSYRFAGGTAAPPPPPMKGNKIMYPVVEPILPAPEGCGGLYLAAPPPPAGTWIGYPPLAPPPPAGTWTGYPSLAPPSAAVHGVYPPPVMQLGPNWWIVDWRYDLSCS